MEWQFDDARERFEELLSRALSNGPQRVRFRNHLIVGTSHEEHGHPTAQRLGLKDAVLNGPDLSGVDLARDPSPMRKTSIDELV